ncbi:lysophospholipase [Alteromonas sp. KS69]|jgi:lysophospholipase|uniref:alpha/beta fold hydrolase n=1 Tax=unclassified Alteromonas TaxID=2614992 RepID=UPI000C0D8DBE|nr:MULTISPECIES: alpha/beta fold hydrolase [unclassified Alteromonas]MBO7923249.1 alpha/beta fold hydrolase [Alteromonas sp. K632G]PHS58922.1 MAG: lysophospholipase [Alteromonas sp.]RUP79602.1 lysophospholipase [Alteromonas sp. KS69]|tara:strand:+ start:10808 stop:11773 length:966 start_codon:yes stop_codon:yes gene_type:complete
MSWTFTSEQDLASTFATEINPFWQTSVTLGEFVGKDNIDVHYAWCIPETPKSTVVISSGRIESYLKYKELIFDLYQNGFAVFILDHRGQGLSGRMTHDPQHGYVADFADYVDDLITFVNDIVKPRQQGELQLLCHSMGGAIGALTLLRDPSLFDKAVLASPMFGIKPALPNWLANSLIKVGLSINKMKKRESGYFFGQTPYIAFPYALNKLTHSKNRYSLFRQLYDEERQIQLGGVTTEWLRAAQAAMNTIELNAAAITTRSLILSADGDSIIENKRQRRVAAKFPNAQVEIIPVAYHEVLTESDDIRDAALSTVFDFLSA